MEPVIQAKGLSKYYKLGEIHHDTIRDMLSHKLRSLLAIFRPPTDKKPISSDFWALQDLNFTIRKGETVAIIGKNGAGKSTLLKILAQITEPTKGQVTMRGRVSSLLEVGTGFHPELSGRDNIYLNGSILGMSRGEIQACFKSIVEFAEIERFIDTPVKHYSSGMYVRLAFAVAAHLKTEILIIDEVLAVGDARFQEKCLGKISDIAGSGRTILFVSHNMDAVVRLCQRAIWLADGKLVGDGLASELVSKYLTEHNQAPRKIDLQNKERPSWVRSLLRFDSIFWVIKQQRPWAIGFGQPIVFGVTFSIPRDFDQIECLYSIFTITGFEIASASSRMTTGLSFGKKGTHSLEVEIADLNLVPGTYYINLGLRSKEANEDAVNHAAYFNILPNEMSSEAAVNTMRCVCIPKSNFRAIEASH